MRDNDEAQHDLKAWLAGDWSASPLGQRHVCCRRLIDPYQLHRACTCRPACRCEYAIVDMWQHMMQHALFSSQAAHQPDCTALGACRSQVVRPLPSMTLPTMIRTPHRQRTSKATARCWTAGPPSPTCPRTPSGSSRSRWWLPPWPKGPTRWPGLIPRYKPSDCLSNSHSPADPVSQAHRLSQRFSQ